MWCKTPQRRPMQHIWVLVCTGLVFGLAPIGASTGASVGAAPALRAVVVDTVVPEAQEFTPGGGAGAGYLYLGYAAEDHCVLHPASLRAGVRVSGCGPDADWAPYAQVGTLRYLVFGPCAPGARDVALDLDPGAVACRGRPLWSVHVTDLQPWG
jgi:hypothetical protein